MNKKQYYQYSIAHLRASNIITEFYQNNKLSVDDKKIRALIFKEYKDNKLDPDGKALRYEFGIKCTADGLLSMLRICTLEKNVDEIDPVFKCYRSIPIFFFPSEIGGINTSRSKMFGDRIDHTLYDLKMYYSEQRKKCRLINTYKKSKTKKWLRKMGSFENIIDWLGVKEIFTDSKYNIYDLEYNNQIIDKYKKPFEYQEQWSDKYYSNLKIKILAYMSRGES